MDADLSQFWETLPSKVIARKRLEKRFQSLRVGMLSRAILFPHRPLVCSFIQKSPLQRPSFRSQPQAFLWLLALGSLKVGGSCCFAHLSESVKMEKSRESIYLILIYSLRSLQQFSLTICKQEPQYLLLPSMENYHVN